MSVMLLTSQPERSDEKEVAPLNMALCWQRATRGSERVSDGADAQQERDLTAGDLPHVRDAAHVPAGEVRREGSRLSEHVTVGRERRAGQRGTATEQSRNKRGT